MRTLQEDIREGIITNITKACPKMLNADIVKLADKIVQDEAMQGVVVKVERKLPTHFCECCEHYDEKAGEDFCFEGYCGDYGGDAYGKWKFAGYVAVEPLIEDIS